MKAQELQLGVGGVYPAEPVAGMRTVTGEDVQVRDGAHGWTDLFSVLDGLTAQSHAQNTDTGTTSEEFTVGSEFGDDAVLLQANDGGHLNILRRDGTAWCPVHVGHFRTYGQVQLSPGAIDSNTRAYNSVLTGPSAASTHAYTLMLNSPNTGSSGAVNNNFHLGFTDPAGVYLGGINATAGQGFGFYNSIFRFVGAHTFQVHVGSTIGINLTGATSSAYPLKISQTGAGVMQLVTSATDIQVRPGGTGKMVFLSEGTFPSTTSFWHNVGSSSPNLVIENPNGWNFLGGGARSYFLRPNTTTINVNSGLGEGHALSVNGFLSFATTANNADISLTPHGTGKVKANGPLEATGQVTDGGFPVMRWRGSLASAPASPREGDCYFDTTNAMLYMRAGSYWCDLWSV